VAATLTFGELRRGTTSWVRQDLTRSVRVGAVSFAVAWLVNFVVITNWGAAFGNVIGAATNGTEAAGAAYVAVMSLTITSLVVYGMEAGWSDLRRSFGAIPKAVARMFRQHGVRMWSIVFWGSAVTLLTSGILDPTLAAAFGLGFLAFAPTAITGLLGKVITGVWTRLIGWFAPRARPRAPGLGGHLVGMVGAAAGFLLASQATETAFQLIAAGALAALSFLVLMNSSSRTASTSAFVLLGVAFWVGGEGIAQAFQDCCGESHHALDPGLEAAGLSAIAGLAGGVAGVIGAGIGSVLAAHPQDPSTWDDPGSGPESGGPTVTGDPIPEGPTRTTTIGLQGDAAREALAAWRKANAEGGQVDIPLPEDEQWESIVSAADGDTARSGHIGTRGRVTGIGAVVEGDDGSISISVEVTAYTPPRASSGPAAADAGHAPADAGNAPADAADAAPPAPSEGAAPEQAGEDRPETETPPPAPGVETPTPDPAMAASPPIPDVGEVIADADAPVRTARGGKGVPDGSDPGVYADWIGHTAAGTLAPEDVAALDALIRGDRDEVRLSGTFTGRWAPLLGSTEPRTDGVAVRFPTGDRVLVRVRNGRVEAKHEASLVSVFVDAFADTAGAAGVKIPKVGEVVDAVRGPLDGFNRAVGETGREVESVGRNPDGSITIRTRRAG